MLGIITTHFSGFIQQICDNGTIAVKQFFYQNSPGIAGEKYIPQCLIDTCWENYLGEKLEMVITAMQELETPLCQVAKSYGIDDAIRYVAGDALADTAGDVFNQLMSQKKELLYAVVAGMVLGRLSSEIKKRIYNRFNRQNVHPQANHIYMNVAIPAAIQPTNQAVTMHVDHNAMTREIPRRARTS